MKLRLSLLVALLGSAAHAQTPLDLGTIFVTSQRLPVSAARTGAPASVIEAPAQTVSLGQVLTTTPGFTLAAKGPLGQQSGFSLRGASQNYVPVYFEGIEISDPSGTQVASDIGAFSGAGLGRIEVLAGSQSALYGSRAIGGVIALQAPRADHDGVTQQASVELGSKAHRALSYAHLRQSGQTETSLTFNYLKTDGFSAAKSGTEADGHESLRLGGRVVQALQNGAEIGGAGYLLRSSTDYDGYGTSPVDSNGYAKRTEVAGRVFAGFDAFGFAQEVSVSQFDMRRRHEDDASDLYTGTRRALAWSANGALSPAMTLNLGLEAQRESYSEATSWSIANGTSDLLGAVAELSYAPRADLDLTMALRRDHHEIFGGVTTARFAGAWRLSPVWTLRAQAGSGQRAPSNYELYNPEYGNASLTPETSQSGDLSVEYLTSKGGLRLTAFALEVENLIDFETSGYAQVEGRSERQGLELSGHLALSAAWTLSGNLTQTHFAQNGSSAWQDGTGLLANLRLEGEMTPRLTGALNLQHASDRGSLEAYTLLHGEARYDLGQGLEGQLRLENLTDADYTLTKGYGTAGRSAYVGVQKRF